MVDNKGKESGGASDIAEALSDQFAAVFTEEDLTKVPVAGNFFQGRLGSKLKTVQITVEDVCKRLTSLRKDKSPGADDISPRILKAISTDIAVPVGAIFNKSFSNGVVTMNWKIANITPIYKKGSRKSAENYRLVSLNSHVFKLVEAMIRDRITEHLDEHQLIRDAQHGFTPGRSCTTNLLSFLDEV